MMNHATSESRDPGVALTALAAASRWAGRAAELAAKPGGRDEDRLASGLFLLVSGSGAAAGPGICATRPASIGCHPGRLRGGGHSDRHRVVAEAQPWAAPRVHVAPHLAAAGVASG